jgi:protein-L-isoaspartate(D-aspartate) O-methyltransferase
MAYVDFVGILHTATERDYLERVVAHDKAECALIAGRFDADYWDGDRRYGFGGYRYDGRWLPVAEAMAAHYGLEAGDRVLDVGCGKGFLLHEFTRAVPGIEVRGLDISAYALEHAKPEVAPYLDRGDAASLPYEDDSFDLVYSINALHNLFAPDVHRAAAEMERVGRGAKHVTVEAYRNESEKVNLLYWQLTCRAFHTPEEWDWVLTQAGYGGDLGCIFFE